MTISRDARGRLLPVQKSTLFCKYDQHPQCPAYRNPDLCECRCHRASAEPLTLGA